jgi:hypothetical protein
LILSVVPLLIVPSNGCSHVRPNGGNECTFLNKTEKCRLLSALSGTLEPIASLGGHAV